MSLLTDDELADLAAEQVAALPDTCTIARATSVSDGAGGQTTTTTTSTVACRYAPESHRAAIIEVAGRVVTIAHWTFTFPSGTDVQAQDTLTVGTRSWEVAGVLSPETWQLATRVRALEIE